MPINYENFVESLEKNIPINITELSHTINDKKHFFSPGSPPIVILTKALGKAIDALEKTPVIFEDDTKITQPQYKKFLTYLNAYRILKYKILASSNKEANKLLKTIDLRIVGLKYRIGSIHGGVSKQHTPDEDSVQRVLDLASAWKSKQKLYPKDAAALTERDIKKINEACSYPLFIHFLIANPSLQQQFFNWTIRDNNNPGQFIEFPATRDRLHNCLLDKRIGRLAPHLLDIVKEKLPESDGYRKILTLPFSNGFEVSHANILDESQSITLSHNYRLTVKEIFAIFARKKNEPGNLEFFASNGIINWSSFELGPWNPKAHAYDSINLHDPCWFKQLPVLEELSKQELEKKLHITLKEGDWVRCVSATRESLNYDITGNHGYLEVAIPQENGNYAIYPFGKFPKHYPTHKLLQLRLLTQTVEARIKYPDENVFYSQRQHAAQPKAITPTQGMKLMYQIRNELLKSLNGNLPFQLGMENCAFWAQDVVTNTEGKEAPNPFKMTLDQMLPTEKHLQKVIQGDSVTQFCIIKLMQFFSHIDGMKIKEKGKPIHKTTHFGNNTHSLYQFQPALLNKKIEEGTLPGVITYGN